jgi:hypothetical protein
MTFTDKQQKEHRETFIHECRQKAWSALCHAEWISKTSTTCSPSIKNSKRKTPTRGPDQGSRNSHRLPHRRKPHQAQSHARAPQQTGAGYESAWGKHRSGPAITRTDSSKRRDQSATAHPCRDVELEGGYSGRGYLITHLMIMPGICAAGGVELASVQATTPLEVINENIDRAKHQ